MHKKHAYVTYQIVLCNHVAALFEIVVVVLPYLFEREHADSPALFIVPF